MKFRVQHFYWCMFCVCFFAQNIDLYLCKSSANMKFRTVRITLPLSSKYFDLPSYIKPMLYILHSNSCRCWNKSLDTVVWRLKKKASRWWFHVYQIVDSFLHTDTEAAQVRIQNLSISTAFLSIFFQNYNFLSMKWQWTYGPTLLPWNNHFHTSEACLKPL